MQVNITLSTGCSFAWQSAKWWQNATTRAATFARFWSHVHRGNAKVCWPYMGYVGDRGYGVFAVGGVRQQIRYRAHRFVWLFSRGEIPTGMEVCHRCDNPACCNPAHLFLGTRRDNHLDAVRKGRKRAWGLQKLNAEQVQEIRALVAAGSTHKAAGHKFGVARTTVSQIINGKSWAHLERIA